MFFTVIHYKPCTIGRTFHVREIVNKEIIKKEVSPEGQGPQVKLPGVLIQATWGSEEQGGREAAHSSTSSVHAGLLGLCVHPSSQIHVYLG